MKRIAMAAVTAAFLAGCGEAADESPTQTEVRKPPAKFAGTDRSARVVARQAYEAGPDGKNQDGVRLVREASCNEQTCVVDLRPREPTFNVEREYIEATRPLFKRLFALKSLTEAKVNVYGKVTSVGGKESVALIASLTCDRSAARQIDWDNVDVDGLKLLCEWFPMVKLD